MGSPGWSLEKVQPSADVGRGRLVLEAVLLWKKLSPICIRGVPRARLSNPMPNWE